MTDEDMMILNPAGEPAHARQLALPSVNGLGGRRIAVLTNHWAGMDRMAHRFRSRAQVLYGAASVELLDIPINGAMSDPVEQKVLQDADMAIVGLAN